MKHGQVQIEAPAAAAPLPGDNPDMAPRQQNNGLDLSRDRVPERDSVFPDFVNGPNIRFALGFFIAAGLLYWVPASKGQVQLVQQKVEQHDKDIGEIKDSQIRGEGKTDRLGEKIDRLIETKSASPAPASPPANIIEKPRPAVHKGSIRKRRAPVSQSWLKRTFG